MLPEGLEPLSLTKVTTATNISYNRQSVDYS
jgi:hypothetical protein